MKFRNWVGGILFIWGMTGCGNRQAEMELRKEILSMVKENSYQNFIIHLDTLEMGAIQSDEWMGVSDRGEVTLSWSEDSLLTLIFSKDLSENEVTVSTKEEFYIYSEEPDFQFLESFRFQVGGDLAKKKLEPNWYYYFLKVE